MLSTAARRIARTAPQYNPADRLYFAGDGTLVDVAYRVGTSPYNYGISRSAYAVAFNGGPCTQAEAQDLLDAYQAAIAAGTEPGDAAQLGSLMFHYLGDLDLSRQAAAESLT